VDGTVTSVANGTVWFGRSMSCVELVPYLTLAVDAPE
jgi:hypothetical protein